MLPLEELSGYDIYFPNNETPEYFFQSRGFSIKDPKIYSDINGYLLGILEDDDFLPLYGTQIPSPEAYMVALLNSDETLRRLCFFTPELRRMIGTSSSLNLAQVIEKFKEMREINVGLLSIIVYPFIEDLHDEGLVYLKSGSDFSYSVRRDKLEPLLQ